MLNGVSHNLLAREYLLEIVKRTDLILTQLAVKLQIKQQQTCILQYLLNSDWLLVSWSYLWEERKPLYFQSLKEIAR